MCVCICERCDGHVKELCSEYLQCISEGSDTPVKVCVCVCECVMHMCSCPITKININKDHTNVILFEGEVNTHVPAAWAVVGNKQEL